MIQITCNFFRVMIINEFSFVESMDRIVLMKDRTIKDVGTLQYLQVSIRFISLPSISKNETKYGTFLF